MIRKKPELLAPAGNLEKLKIAIHYGADAVYFGGQEFSLRTRAGNFTVPDMYKGIEYAHSNNVKAYVAINIFFNNDDLDSLVPYLKDIEMASPDAVIVTDPGAISLIRQFIPTLPLYLSTQANTTNWKACEFWEKQGITRICLARELSFKEIEKIRRNQNIELEIFIHGAMCISYSGRCWMSKYMTGRDANSGDCAQPCRWKYHLVEEKRPGEYFSVEGDNRGTYLYNSKDLNLIEHIPELMKLGVDSFKIEGRMKSINYLASVVNIYRQAIDRYWTDPDNYSCDPLWLKELKKVGNRDYTTGLYTDKSSADSRNIYTSTSERKYTFAGVVIDVLNDNKAKVQVKNKIINGDEIEIFCKGVFSSASKIERIITIDGEYKEIAQPNDVVILQLTMPAERYSLIRRTIQP